MSDIDKPDDRLDIQDQIPAEDLRGTKPMYFPKKRDDLIKSTSTLRRFEGGKWVLANMMAPTEIIARAEKIAQQIREELERVFAGLKDDPDSGALSPDKLPQSIQELIEQMARCEGYVRLLGGNVRRAVMDVYCDFDFDHYWFKDAFGNHDKSFIKDQLEHIAHEIGIGKANVGKLKVLDVGIGGEGRIPKILLDLVKEMDPNHFRSFRRNLKGFDIVPKVVDDARSALSGMKLNPRNIFEADFNDLPPRYKQEKFHLITAMMHTPWHNVTEEEWIKFVQNMSQALAPGGRLVFDNVPIIEPYDRKEEFDDLYSFYTLLWRRYCDETQPVIDKIMTPYMEGRTVPLLRKLPRYFVKDFTAGVKGKSFIREIPTDKFLIRICEDNNIPLEWGITHSEWNEHRGNRGLMTELGERWIEENNLGPWLDGKIRERIKRRTGEKPSNEQVNEVYAEIIYQIALQYRNKYVSFRKTRKGK